MDLLRGRLIARVDEIVAQLIAQDTPIHSQLRIEARLLHPQDTSGLQRRVVIDTVDIDTLRHQILSQHSSPIPSTPINAALQPSIPSNAPPVTSHDSGMYVPYMTHLQSHNGLHVAHTPPQLAGPPLSGSFSTSQHDLLAPHPPTHSNYHHTPPATPSSGDQTRQSSGERVPTKKRIQGAEVKTKSDQQAIDRLIEGIWEQIHNLKSLSLADDVKEMLQWALQRAPRPHSRMAVTSSEFADATKICRHITTSNRAVRALEVLVQAYWIDCYDGRLTAIKQDRPELRPQEQKKVVLHEACTSFGWAEKELRNRMGIWKGYREIKDHAGWTALVFAGQGIYRFCKYRLGFDEESTQKLRAFRQRAEVAADTLHPQWRQLLALVGEGIDNQWYGHPHDWTVGLREDQEPWPLAMTYKQWDPNFTFTNLEDSIIDTEKFDHDPRRFENGPVFLCKSCSQKQSDDPDENECECFPSLYSPNPKGPAPVQVFRTENGKNNGLIACCSFDPGQAVGEFVGLLTCDLSDVDVMQSQAGSNSPYQIWQGRCGNFTRFMNHSCAPNCHFETFSWLGVQRIVVVSNGVAAGTELTVDYSSHYWDHLDKICLCGESTCRYKSRRMSNN